MIALGIGVFIQTVLVLWRFGTSPHKNKVSMIYHADCRINWICILEFILTFNTHLIQLFVEYIYTSLYFKNKVVNRKLLYLGVFFISNLTNRSGIINKSAGKWAILANSWDITDTLYFEILHVNSLIFA